MSKKILLVVVVLAMSSLAMAANVYYQDAGSHLWNDDGNWGDGLDPTPTAQPGVDDVALFQNNGVPGASVAVNIGTGDAISINSTWLGNSIDGLNLTVGMTGTGSVTTVGDFIIAYSDDTVTTVVNMADDTFIDCGGYFVAAECGYGTINMTGNAQITALGLWNTMWTAGSTSHVNIGGDASIVTTIVGGWGGFYWGNIDPVGTGGAYYGDPHMNLTENGSITITKGPDGEDYALGVIADGRFTAEGLGRENFKIINNGDGTCTFKVIPESMTLVLLGLGGLFLRSRKS